MKIALIDNYDSFTYNLYHLVKELNTDVDVLKNDGFELTTLAAYDGILLSPGPGVPEEAGLLLDVIKKYAPTKPILGVCLGEQAIAEAFGGELTNLDKVYHGIQSPIDIVRDSPIFQHIPHEIQVGRYHSWVVSLQNLPRCLETTALSKDGNIMAIQHKRYQVYGIQFHPESILTPSGKQIVQNWLEIINNLHL